MGQRAEVPYVGVWRVGLATLHEVRHLPILNPLPIHRDYVQVFLVSAVVVKCT